MDERLRRRLHKIVQLAKRGVGGERLAAESMLATLLRKYNLTLDDLSLTAKRDWVEFAFEDQYELVLLEQVIRRVTQQNEFDRCHLPQEAGKSWYELTPSEHAEVEGMFAVLKANLRDQFERTLAAFIQKNNLYGPMATPDDVEVTSDERTRQEQIAMIARDLTPVAILKAIK
jgi:hypothetical protein